MVILLSLSGCDNDKLGPNIADLEKKDISFTAEAGEATIKVSKGGWVFKGLAIGDSIHDGSTDFASEFPEKYVGSWFTFMEQDGGRKIVVKVDENNENKRWFSINVDVGGGAQKLTVTQESKH